MTNEEHSAPEVPACPIFPRSLIAFQRRFRDEAACAAYLADVRWPEGFRCPACGHGRAWRLETKPWTYECRRCTRQTPGLNPGAGTIMHGSKLVLNIWFWAAMATHSNGGFPLSSFGGNWDRIRRRGCCVPTYAAPWSIPNAPPTWWKSTKPRSTIGPRMIPPPAAVAVATWASCSSPALSRSSMRGRVASALPEH